MPFSRRNEDPHRTICFLSGFVSYQSACVYKAGFRGPQGHGDDTKKRTWRAEVDVEFKVHFVCVCHGGGDGLRWEQKASSRDAGGGKELCIARAGVKLAWLCCIR